MGNFYILKPFMPIFLNEIFIRGEKKFFLFKMIYDMNDLYVKKIIKKKYFISLILFYSLSTINKIFKIINMD